MLYEQNIEFLKSLLLCNMVALLSGIIAIIFNTRVFQKGSKSFLSIGYPALLLMLCYFVSVAAITIIPLPYSQKFHISTVNVVPIVNTFEDLVGPLKKRQGLLAKDVAQNIIGNIIMFIPLGIFLPVADKRFENYKRVFLFAVAGSMLIELAQYFSRYINNYRQVDIDDVILNTLGAILGYYIYESWTVRKQTFSKAKTET